MNGGLVFLIVLIFLVLGAYGGWVAWSRLRAQKLGLQPPSLNPFSSGSSTAPNYPAPAPGGIRGWIDTQVRKFKNRNNRFASGAYEGDSGYTGARGGHRLDPDEAWDARVGNEAYYEEQELGLHAPPQPYRSQQTGNPFDNSAAYHSADGAERGRSRSRDYDEGGHGGARHNPFGDDNTESLRGVSPRPLDHGVDTSYGGAPAPLKTHGVQKGKGSAESSPTENRRSIFRENM